MLVFFGVAFQSYLASPGYYQLWSGGVRLNADTEYGPWPEFVQRVYYDSWNVTDLFRSAASHDDDGGGGDNKSVASVVFGLRIGPGTYGHAGAQKPCGHVQLCIATKVLIKVPCKLPTPMRDKLARLERWAHKLPVWSRKLPGWSIL